jgi:hypothetical protein
MRCSTKLTLERISIEMKLPPDLEFHEDIRLLIYRPKGVINEAEINRVIGVIEGIEAASQEPFNRFSDASEAHEVELNFRYVIEVSLHRRQAHAGRVPVKSAILATDSSIVHYARLLVLLTEGSTIKVRLFADCKEAAEWLSVPVELLNAKKDR